MIKALQKHKILYSVLLIFMVSIVFVSHKLKKRGQILATEFISQQFETQLEKVKNKIQLEWEDLSISFFPFKIKMKNVVINIINNKTFPEPIQIKIIQISPDYLALLNRTLSAKIIFINPDTEIYIQKNKKQKKRFKLQEYLSLNQLKNIPISKVVLESARVSLKEQTRILAEFANLDASIRLNPSKITIEAQDSFIDIGDRPVFSAAIKAHIKPNLIYVNFFKVKNDLSWIDLSAMAVGDFNKGQDIDTGNLQVKGTFLSEDLTALVHVIDSSFDLPFKGKIELNSKLNYGEQALLEGYINLSTEDFYIGDTFLSEVNIKGEIQKQNLIFNKFHIKNPPLWDINLSQSKVKLKHSYPFQVKISVKDSQLSNLLEMFKLKKRVITSQVNGNWKCNGNIFGVQNIRCRGTSYFDNSNIYSHSNKNILKLPKLKAKNELSFKDNVLQILSKAELGTKSSFNIENNWDKENLFSSTYHGIIHFSDIKNLIKLDPEGIVNITNGSLKVKDEKLDIKAQLKLKDFVLQGFRMGQVETQVNYTETGILHFRQVKGQIRKSNYKGNVSINIPRDTIRLFAHFPFITLENIKYALEERVSFPFKITGKGTLSAYLNGPLKVSAMNYNLDAKLFKIKWENESFDKATIQLNANKGTVKTKKIKFFKNKSQVSFSGTIDPKGQLLAKITGREMLIQESENISKILGSEITGTIDFDTDLKGFWLEPQTTANILVKKTFYKGYPIKNSHIFMNIRRHQLEVKGSISNKATVQKFIFPYKKEGLVEIKAQTKNLNIKDLFHSTENSSALYNQFESKINSKIDVSFRRDKFTQSVTGDLKVNSLTLKTNSYKLVSQFPFSLTLNRGRIKTDPISLQSGSQFLSLTHTRKNQIKINGDTKLDFLIFLFPFMKVWEGNLTVDINISPRLSNFSPKGTLQVQNGFVQLNQYIDPFEETYANIKINNTNFEFLNFYTKIGGGTLKAQGDIDFIEKNNTPIKVEGHFVNVQMNSLPDLYTRGSGQISLTGKKFPYTLAITAAIKNSRIEKEFISDQSNQVQISPRLSHLEKNRDYFEPIKMKLNLSLIDPVQIENSTMKSSFKGKMKITGYPTRPLLSGRLTALPGGTIVFRDHQFEILSAQVKYKNNKPSNPLINLKAKTSIQEEGENNDFADEYDIYLRVRGKGNRAVFKLTSTSNLSENEIASLLAFGVRSVNFDPGDTMNNFAKYSYYQLGPVLFQKAIGRELKNTLGVDQFLIVPHISAKDNSPSTKLIVRKKLFNRLNLSAGQTILDNHPESDVKAQYKINKNVSVIGVWQNEDPIDGRDTDPNTLGLDLEYQLDF